MAKLSDLPPSPSELLPHGFEGGREEWEFFCGMVAGARAVMGTRFVSTTNGKTMFIVDLDSDTESARIKRGYGDARPLYFAVLAQLDSRATWEPSTRWGPDPWKGKSDG